jgi:hypothetical protein
MPAPSSLIFASCAPSGLAHDLVQSLAIELDNVAVGVEDVDLRVPGDGIGAELKVAEIAIRQVFVKAFSPKPFKRFAVALDPQGQMHVVGVIGLVASDRGVRTDENMNAGAAIANVEPDSGVIEYWTCGLFQFKDIPVKAPRALQVVDGNQNVMKV